MNNLNKSYHKGKYRSGEWSKHLRPYLKRLGNKRWRKDGKNIDNIEEIVVKHRKKYKSRRLIKVKITKEIYGDLKWSRITKYRTLRDAENAMKQANIIKAEILEK